MTETNQYIIRLPDTFGTTPLIIADGKCDACLVRKLCLIADNAVGEYSDVKICKACIDKHFDKAATNREVA